MESASSALPGAGETGRRSSFTGSLIKYCVMAVIIGSLLRFVSGRADWSRAWFYVAFTLGFQIAVGIVLQRVNPDLLVERSRIQKGTKGWDKALVPIIAGLGPLTIWCVAALDVRAHWPPSVPVLWSMAGFAMCALGSVVTFWAMLTNRFFSAMVRIQTERGHTVVDSGPYRYVRHPGYSGALAFTLGSPIAIGSWIALAPAAFTAAVLVLRTALEDRTLRLELVGYQEYTRRVRSRLLPGLW